MKSASKRGKRPDDRPARATYWARRQLEINKVRRLMRSCGMNESEARAHWRKVRLGRKKF